jgi:hypothetical protein
VAVTVSAARKGQRRARLAFGILTAVLVYALVANVIEAPDGIAISGFFIVGIIAVSLISRVTRTTELRVDTIAFNRLARRYISDALDRDGELNFIAKRHHTGKPEEYDAKEVAQRGMNPVPGTAHVLFLEVDVVDPSEFSSELLVRGYDVDGHRVLRIESPAVPNAIAAILLALRDLTGVRPHCYFEWSEGNPLGHLFRYLILGRGDTAPVVREILREAEPDPAKRPGIHVGG